MATLEPDRPTPRSLPRWLTKPLLALIVSALASGLLLVLLMVIGQLMAPGLVGFKAAVRVALASWFLGFWVILWRVMFPARRQEPAQERPPAGAA